MDEKKVKEAPWWKTSVWPLYSLAMAVTAAYVLLENPIFHQVCFGAIIVGCTLSYPAFAAENTKDLTDGKAVRSRCTNMIAKAAALMISAFGIWNIDNVACSTLRSLRSSLPVPLVFLSPLLQFHAIWHILTCAAGDYAICGVMYMWCKGHSDRLNAKLEGKIFGLFPSVRIEQVKQKSAQKVK